MREAGHGVAAALLRLGRIPRWRVPRPERLLFAPQDLRTSDATYAADIAEGLFAFAGRIVEARGRSPFAVTPPSRAWSEALYGFGWLRHHKAAGSPAARENARALVAAAVGPCRRQLEHGPGRDTQVAARRVISFLCQSPLVLNGADHGFYAGFLHAIGQGVAVLERDAARARRPLDRLAAATALSYAALCCSGLENRLRRATRLLSAELDAQILPDGGHVTRNPGVLVDLLLDLLPLRLLYKSRGIDAPEALSRAVDRMMPMLRYLRHGNGDLALFNGMGTTAGDHLATLLSYDTVRAPVPVDAKPSGFTRLEGGSTLLLADTGAPPPFVSAAAAHAGCLSVELSSGSRRIVVNAGAPRSDSTGRLAGRPAGRETAAHSTITVAGASSATILDAKAGRLSRWLARRLGPVLVAGPSDISVRREIDPDGWTTCRASHDGYRARFGVTHERWLRMAPDGSRLAGEDRLIADRSDAEVPDAVLRFHLHPTVRVSGQDGSASARLDLPEGERWRFEVEGRAVSIAESTFFGGPEGWRPSLQLVVRVAARGAEGSKPIRWSFERLPGPRAEPPAAAPSEADDPSA